MFQSRRFFLKATSSVAFSGLLPSASLLNITPPARIVQVVVWDERQPTQKQAYENFLGNHIADHLRTQPDFSVHSVGLDDPEQGLSSNILSKCDVLIWWGHQRQGEISQQLGKNIVERIKQGSTSLIALHSAHWATPFVEAMNEITKLQTEQTYSKSNKQDVEINYVAPPKPYTMPTYDTRITPYTMVRKFPDGKQKVEVHLPYCCFPAYRGNGKPSTVQVLKADHPIIKGIPHQFEIAQTEMYDEHFHVPSPDEVIFEERWPTGEWFRSGMVWRLGKGRIFYFRPGHETYPIFKQQWPLQILTNATRWLATQQSGK